MSVQVSSCAASTYRQPMMTTMEVRHNRPVHCACYFWQMIGKVNEREPLPGRTRKEAHHEVLAGPRSVEPGLVADIGHCTASDLPLAVRGSLPHTTCGNGYRFFFFSNEGTPLEGRHVHIRKGVSVAKFWLDPEPSLVSSWGLAPKELNSLERVVRDNLDLFRRKWDERFGF